MIMENNILDLLQDWYLEQCNGDWEHEYGIKIDTLDNPGWNVIIDLKDTKYEYKKFREIDRRLDDNNNWIQCNVVNSKFQGAGGPKKLVDIIKIFIDWINEDLLP